MSGVLGGMKIGQGASFESGKPLQKQNGKAEGRSRETKCLCFFPISFFLSFLRFFPKR